MYRMLYTFMIYFVIDRSVTGCHNPAEGSLRTVLVRRFSSLLVLAALAPCTISAQEFRATLTGHISDPAGGSVANAKVTARNLATNEEQSQNTNEQGDFTIPLLPPGNYSVSVEATGF